MISRASGGLVRQIDILADKSLLAASIAGTRAVEAHYVNAAIEDTGNQAPLSVGEAGEIRRVFLGHHTVDAIAMFSTIAVVMLGVLGWQDIRSPSPEITSLVASMPLEPKRQCLFRFPHPVPYIPQIPQ